MKRRIGLLSGILASVVFLTGPSIANASEIIIGEKEISIPTKISSTINPSITQFYPGNDYNIIHIDKLISKSQSIEYHKSTFEVEIINSDLLDTSRSSSVTVRKNAIPDNNSLSKATSADETGKNEKTKHDSSDSIKVKLVVNYAISTKNKLDYIKLTKVKSKLTANNGSTTSYVGSGVYISSNKLTIGQTGWYSGGYQTNAILTKNLPSKACDKTYSIPQNWKAVSTTRATVGATQIVQLRRGTSGKPWLLELVNNIVESQNYSY